MRDSKGSAKVQPETNTRLLARKIEALDPQAQHAVEIAVDSLLRDAGLVPNRVVDSRIATLALWRRWLTLVSEYFLLAKAHSAMDKRHPGPQ